jgi:acetyl-CoA synthetase
MGPDLSMPPLSPEVTEHLRETVHERIVPANPFDFQMFDWNDEEQNAKNFSALLAQEFDIALCLLDYPREDLCDQSTWSGAERGFVRAAKQTGTKAAIMATFSDTISEPVAARLMKEGVVMLAGIDTGLAGIQAAVDVGAAWKKPLSPQLLPTSPPEKDASFRVLNEAESKRFLAQFGIPIPAGKVVNNAEEAVNAADELGYPVVVKLLGVSHKTDVGGVRLNLRDGDEVSTAVRELTSFSETFLVEKMVAGVVAELILGVAQDEQFGPYLLIGGGGILVEMMKDSASLLLPTTREQVVHALEQLKSAPLFNGFRGAPPADLNAAVDVILIVTEIVEKDPRAINELDINPLMLLSKGQGVIAADALISIDTNSINDGAI